ncbi:MAG: hypothetical protein B7Y61_21640 [Rhizobiales bacterium 35-66-30]|jgi:hypothetical protein|nr:MAG: hypothetical protein B7Y61_21640 [Rhizobiales bacterium 35-66-30]
MVSRGIKDNAVISGVWDQLSENVQKRGSAAFSGPHLRHHDATAPHHCCIRRMRDASSRGRGDRLPAAAGRRVSDTGVPPWPTSLTKH